VSTRSCSKLARRPSELALPRTLPNTREQLWGVLCEAAEIEHNLMCCYLYACFSLKERLDEDVTPDELAAIKRWRAEILDVAIEEMAHLAIVSNILSSLGAPAHFARQNFPVPAGYHPAGVVVKLAPFNPDTLDHFIYLERPEGVDSTDGAGFETGREYHRMLNNDRLMSGAMDYATVGELYAAIADGLKAMAAEMGEEALFVGDVAHQVGPGVLSLPNLTVVRCAKSACEAIDAIVRQGEGSHPEEPGSHYQRFLAIRENYRALVAANPAFRPARAAAHNPVMRRPPTPEGKVWIDAEPAATLLDLGNALYNHSVRCLSLAYAGLAPQDQRSAIDAGIELMRLLTPVACALTDQAASTEQTQCTAGLSFATLRSAAALPADITSIEILAERLHQIARHAAGIAEARPEISALAIRVAQGVEELAQRTERKVATSSSSAENMPDGVTTGQQASGGAAAPEIAEGAALDLVFDSTRCIHARNCVLGQPAVFKANVEGPWLDPDAASAEALVTVAAMCPSGAVRYRRKDGGADEAAPPVNLLQLRENGPLGVRADIQMGGVGIGMRATLCRCGASTNKPFCDGSHVAIEFHASGEPASRTSEPLRVRNGPLAIDPQVDGPLLVTGNLEMCSGTGRTFDRVTSARLCRCGGSANKPYCDGTHRRIGFTS
jgi:CDGSH-type Zn-finger protein/uncharacterized Fe-S cluster protein YjdI